MQKMNSEIVDRMIGYLFKKTPPPQDQRWSWAGDASPLLSASPSMVGVHNNIPQFNKQYLRLVSKLEVLPTFSPHPVSATSLRRIAPTEVGIN